ncbi:MAG: hypothetical protein HOE30_01995 [Deltaproteobacteria bacterium]|nr:hypothetical protein [Deltaproteobacteria bacterium]MBT4087243.1 hypothetical protein [Deltaproteobacteria bacterium]MBT4264889.1 hypothetical protein [Deltaproteobacteria bacterium]MBT4640025.1 hypothetical protein [Deltaproteobacteria bacterium]MBT6612301.1 hypothetical protein [Deltaproteobacteria bacterium]
MKNKIKNSETSKVPKTDQKTLSDELIESANTTITIDDLYSQLESLKHDIEIETIQNKIKIFDRFFKNLGDDEAVLMDMISSYKQNKLSDLK